MRPISWRYRFNSALRRITLKVPPVCPGGAILDPACVPVPPNDLRMLPGGDTELSAGAYGAVSALSTAEDYKKTAIYKAYQLRLFGSYWDAA